MDSWAELDDWPENDTPLVIGLAGGSGSGKTTIAQAVLDRIGDDHAVLIQHDSYYRDQGHLAIEARAKTNYDHPDSLETDLLAAHLRQLRSGREIQRPVYDFSAHTRSTESVTVAPGTMVLVEGILVLAEAELRELMDLKIYVDTDADLRLIRRLQRDITERGRTVASVLDQYAETVRPMHLAFVEQSRRYADIIIPEGFNPNAVATVVAMIREVIGRSA
jgi:uridine kinase